MASRRVTILPEAREDIDNAAIYRAREAGIELALRFYQALDQAFLDLLAMPGMGKKISFKSNTRQEARQWRVPGFDAYLIFYRADPKGITVLRILHGSRDVNVELCE